MAGPREFGAHDASLVGERLAALRRHAVTAAGILIVRVLLVEDDGQLALVVSQALRDDHIQVEWVADGLQAVRAATTDRFDAVLLDLHLPGCDGFEACRRLRSGKIDTPIVVITGSSDADERVRLLDAGADDILVKPFNLRELLARVRAVTRRSRSRHLNATIDYGPLSLDLRDHVITLRGRRLDLTATEYRLLAHLVKRAEAVVSRDELIRHVWGSGFSQSNTLDVYISYLRHQLGSDGPALIRTVRGLGYELRERTA